MKKILAALIVGLVIGLIPSFISFPIHPTHVEASLAQMIYENLKTYGTKDYRLDQVLQVVEELAQRKRSEIPTSEIYAPLEALAAKQIEEEAAENLKIAETRIQNLKNQIGILPIVENRVYAEVLQPGNGETVTSQDIIQIQFKEYDLDQHLLKETSESVTIPLAQTIKGFQKGLIGAKIGETRKLYIHPEYGFGKISHTDPNRLLIYEVTIKEKRNQ